MANSDHPNGFRLVSTGVNLRWVEAWGESGDTSDVIAVGDMVIQDSSDPGYFTIAASNSGVLGGLALTPTVGGKEAPEEFLICDDPNAEFEGQCSGTPTQATINADVDIEGTTGIMEINENATTEKVIHITKLFPSPDNEMGEFARLQFKIRIHSNASKVSAET